MSGGRGKLKQADRERGVQSLMTTNWLKRLESSVEAFRITLRKLQENHSGILRKIAESGERHRPRICRCCRGVR
ncbi:MAG: hypothetical protein R3B46_13165 [Phycisphaerales bacterium]